MVAQPGPSGSLRSASQAERDALAVEVLATAEMAAAVARVEQSYAADPVAASTSATETIERAAAAIATAAVLYALAEDTARPHLTWTCTAAHDSGAVHVPNSGYGIENPDNVYRNTALSGASSYEIRGRLLQPAPAELHFELRDAVPGTAATTMEGGELLAGLSDRDLRLDQDGNFTITVDATDGDGRPDHIRIPAAVDSFLIVRALFNDWANERTPPMEIVRTGGPAAAAEPTLDDLAGRAAALLGVIAPYWQSYFGQFMHTRPANEMSTPRLRPAGRGMSASLHFDLGPDDALVLTVDPLGAASMGIQITDPWGVAYEYVSRTSSFNTNQAVANADGTYTYVVSIADPGVPNWLDPDGHGGGMLAVRWQALNEVDDPSTGVRGARLVRLDRLDDAVAAGTARLSATERQAQRDQRAAAYWRRLDA